MIDVALAIMGGLISFSGFLSSSAYTYKQYVNRKKDRLNSDANAAVQHTYIKRAKKAKYIKLREELTKNPNLVPDCELRNNILLFITLTLLYDLDADEVETLIDNARGHLEEKNKNYKKMNNETLNSVLLENWYIFKGQYNNGINSMAEFHSKISAPNCSIDAGKLLKELDKIPLIYDGKERGENNTPLTFNFN